MFLGMVGASLYSAVVGIGRLVSGGTGVPTNAILTESGDGLQIEAGDYLLTE